MLRQHYSSPITAVRQWRGYDATANVFNDVIRHL
ncbi:recombinase, partial [Klebsiella pneumoniae]